MDDATDLNMMLIRNAHLLAPWDQGKADLLMIAGRIIRVGPVGTIPSIEGVEELDLGENYLVPGLIDGHVHILGGGGEGGPATRTPEITLTRLTTAGVTTVVGLLGTDGTTRSLASLLAKARALEDEGLTTLIYTGAYEVPTPTLLGSVRDDIALIDRVVGAKVAVSDHRSSQPELQQLRYLASECRVGGMLGRKPGLLHLHIGGGEGRLDPLFEVLGSTEIPASQLYPTHVARSVELLQQAAELNRAGATVDVTAGGRAAEAVSFLLREGADSSRITLSSDGNGSMPRFDERGNFVGLGVGTPHTLLRTVRDLVKGGMSLPDALAFVTENPARQLGLKGLKGAVAVGADADLISLDQQSLQLQHVWAGGRMMVRDGEAVVFGTFEE